jgi:hypothetical protein
MTGFPTETDFDLDFDLGFLFLVDDFSGGAVSIPISVCETELTSNIFTPDEAYFLNQQSRLIVYIVILMAIIYDSVCH